MPLLRLPDALAGAAHATVTRWLVSSGELFTADQILVELATTDATVAVRTATAGRLARIVAEVGITILPGATLGESVEEPAMTDASPAVAAAAPLATTGATATAIPMPQAGNTMEEGKVVAWRVKPGDTVTVGQILCEIETDKSVMEYESPVAGIIGSIVVGDGQSIAVRQPIAFLADGIASAPGPRAAVAPAAAMAKPAYAGAASPVGAVPTVPSMQAEAGAPRASPAARRMAQAGGIDLASISAGSGPGGRILSSDLPTRAPAPSVPTSAPGKRPLSKMRRAIATNLQQSKQTVPHFYLAVTVDAGALVAYAKKRKADAGCSVNDVVLAALGRVIQEFPPLRSRFEADGITEFAGSHIGIAVGLDDGLVVPVVLGVERLTLTQLAVETKRIVENARKGKVENQGKAVFSVSNLGMFGIDRFSAIINPPESGILAVGAAREAVIVKDGAMRAGRLMELTLSADHRVVDGLQAARAMGRLRELLESPEQLV